MGTTYSNASYKRFNGVDWDVYLFPYEHNHDNLYLGKTAKAADSDKLDGFSQDDFGRQPPYGEWHNTLSGAYSDEKGYLDSMFVNKLAFYPLNLIEVETSTNGTDWSPSSEYSDTNLKKLTGGDSSAGINIPNLGTNGAGYKRITFTQRSYVYINTLYIYSTKVTGTLNVKVEKFHYGNQEWELVEDWASISGWPSHHVLRHANIAWNDSTSQYEKVRLTFYGETTNSSYINHVISKIEWWGGYPAGNRHPHMGIDEDKNVDFYGILEGYQVYENGRVRVYSPNNKPALTDLGSIGDLSGMTSTEIANAISNAIANLVDSSPGTLDTLNELASALGDDPNFATTIANQLAAKAPLNAPTFTGTITLGSAGVLYASSFDVILGTNVSSGGTLKLESLGDVLIEIDNNNNDTGKTFKVRANGTTDALIVDESGNLTISGNATAGGQTLVKTNDSRLTFDDIPVNGQTLQAITSNWAYDHSASYGNGRHVPAAGSSGQFLAYNGTWATPPNDNTWRGIDNIPVNGQTNESISSDWAYDHANGNNPHGITKSDVGLANVDNVADALKYVKGLNEQKSGNQTKIWRGTQAEYNAIGTKDANTLYFVH